MYFIKQRLCQPEKKKITSDPSRMHAARRRISNEKPIRSLDDNFLGWKKKAYSAG